MSRANTIKLMRAIEDAPGLPASHYAKVTDLPISTVYRQLKTIREHHSKLISNLIPYPKETNRRVFPIPEALKQGVIHTDKPAAHLATALAALKSFEYPPGIPLTKAEILVKIKKDFLGDAQKAIYLISELQNLLAIYCLITGDLTTWEEMLTSPRFIATQELDELIKIKGE